ncbi:DedA family protein [Qipengyuania atrilutea]|uniref:DedA family protein n=1 Tax=Qipengyuania atrilutea TaxID=2744473 RepID=A0A850H1H8_9SPHN|nr:DedA family protein [Actirhodobacter atriluteus]NVD43793.1 DedA family protein [Actirhodobacter atriluteus]
MDDLIVEIISRLGYVGIAVLMMLENIFPPMPSEAVMGASALAIERGRLDYWMVLSSGTLGTLAGNYLWYWAGHRYGYERLRPLIDRFGRWLTMEWEDVEAAGAFFRKHGHWVVLVLRSTPVMRTMISLPAGLAHMNAIKFCIFTAIGAAIWNAILIAGTQWLTRTFEGSDNIVTGVIIGTIVLSVVAYLWRLAVWTPRSKR